MVIESRIVTEGRGVKRELIEAATLSVTVQQDADDAIHDVIRRLRLALTRLASAMYAMASTTTDATRTTTSA